MKAPHQRHAIILTGGGSEGAYQVGVLKAFAEISMKKQVAFPVITGVSVGAINAAALASNFDNFKLSVEMLENFWRKLRTHNVLDARLITVFFNGFRMFLPELIPAMPKILV